jgi:protein-S-isoprenylcysteine O-methyltransferase Ste14
MTRRKIINLMVTSLAVFGTLTGLIIKIIAFTQGQWMNAGGAALFYLLMFTLFIFRRSSHESLEHPLHLGFALAGTLLPLALQINPHAPPLAQQIALPVEALGILISILSLATLGRGFGIIAANREIKTHGLYTFVRHPLYTGEALWFGALVLQNLSALNFLLFALQIACQIKRMRDEEALLLQDPIYAAYYAQVRYRMCPGLF